MNLTGIILILIVTSPFTSGTLCPEDASDGPCASFPPYVPQNPTYILGTNWYVPMINQYGIRNTAKALMGGQCLSNTNEMATVQSKTHFDPGQTIVVGAKFHFELSGFGGTKILYSNCTVTGIISLSCSCINGPNANPPDIYCGNLNPHTATVIEVNQPLGYWIAVFCTSDNHRDFFVLSATPCLTPEAQIAATNKILSTGLFSQSNFYYQQYFS